MYTGSPTRGKILEDTEATLGACFALFPFHSLPTVARTSREALKNMEEKSRFKPDYPLAYVSIDILRVAEVLVLLKLFPSLGTEEIPQRLLRDTQTHQSQLEGLDPPHRMTSAEMPTIPGR